MPESTTSPKLDKGDTALSAFMEPGEIFITNASRTRESWHDEDDSTAQEIANRIAMNRDSRYSSVRVIDQAFDIHGKLLPYSAAVVGTLKATTNTE